MAWLNPLWRVQKSISGGASRRSPTTLRCYVTLIKLWEKTVIHQANFSMTRGILFSNIIWYYGHQQRQMCEWQIMGFLQCPKAHRDFFVKMRCDVRLYIWLLFTLLACLLDTMKIFALSSFSFCCSVWLGVRPKDRFENENREILKIL